MRKLFACLLLVLAFSVPTASANQPEATDVKGVWLTTDYPVVTVRAGEEARFNHLARQPRPSPATRRAVG
jgi:hypothetical protein